MILSCLVLVGQDCQIQPPNGDEVPDKPPVELTYWSVFNNSEEIEALIEAYKEQSPHVTIEYRKLDINEYEASLTDALAKDRGPDIFSYHANWLPSYTGRIEPYPAAQIPLNEFVPIVKETAVIDGQLYGLPFSVDTLALFYNPKLLASAGVVSPPKTWDEFDEAVKKLVLLENKSFIREGAAIGAVNNVNRGIDPLQLLMLQNETEMINSERTEATFANTVIRDTGERYSPGLVALEKFLSYSRSTSSVYTWNNNIPSAFDEFTGARLGMLFNYAYNYNRILALNPNEEFRVADAPQIEGDTSTPGNIALANFWLEGVSKKSKKQLEAWKFILFATSFDGSFIFADMTDRPSARKDILALQEQQAPHVAPFARQAAIAETWYQKDASVIEGAMKEMVNSVFTGKRTPENALQLAETQITNLMKGQ